MIGLRKRVKQRPNIVKTQKRRDPLQNGFMSLFFEVHLVKRNKQVYLTGTGMLFQERRGDKNRLRSESCSKKSREKATVEYKCVSGSIIIKKCSSGICMGI